MRAIAGDPARSGRDHGARRRCRSCSATRAASRRSSPTSPPTRSSSPAAVRSTSTLRIEHRCRRRPGSASFPIPGPEARGREYAEIDVTDTGRRHPRRGSPPSLRRVPAARRLVDAPPRGHRPRPRHQRPPRRRRWAVTSRSAAPPASGSTFALLLPIEATRPDGVTADEPARAERASDARAQRASVTTRSRAVVVAGVSGIITTSRPFPSAPSNATNSGGSRA